MTATTDTDLLAFVRQAINDPGSVVPREDGESIGNWSARAVLAAIEEHPVLEIRPYYPTQDAYDAACRALEKHRKRADDAEAAIERARTVASGWKREAREVTARIGAERNHVELVRQNAWATARDCHATEILAALAASGSVEDQKSKDPS